jgi:hypothetical protein
VKKPPAKKKKAPRKPAAKPKPEPPSAAVPAKPAAKRAHAQAMSAGEPAAPARTKPAKPKRRRQTRTVDKRGAMLAAYAECGSIRDAAAAAGIGRRQHYDWMKTDPAYFERFQEAKTHAAQTLEDDAVEWARRGVFEPNVFQGRFVYPQEEYVETPAVIGPRGAIREPEKRAWRDVPGAPPFGTWRRSEGIMLRLLAAFMPEKYRRNASVELSGPGGGAIEIVQRLNAGRARVAARAKTGGESDAR